MTIENYFAIQTKLVLDYFEEWHFRDNHHFSDGERTRYCVLFDAFNKCEKQTDSSSDNNSNHHNCIGCNLEEGCLSILDFLKKYCDSENTRTYLTIYTFLFYSLAERVAVVYKELGIVNGNNFDWVKFPVLRNIKHWANFFKHPKAYMFLHHPSYFLENDSSKPNFFVKGEINNEFVEKFYSANPDNNELRNQCKNKDGWNVIFPDILQLTKDLCFELDKVCEFILIPENLQKLRPFTTLRK
jgi:hypothetical protein